MSIVNSNASRAQRASDGDAQAPDQSPQQPASHSPTRNVEPTLLPLPDLSAGTVEELGASLGSDDFFERQAASAEFLRRGKQELFDTHSRIRDTLQSLVTSSPSIEVRRRGEHVIERLDRTFLNLLTAKFLIGKSGEAELHRFFGDLHSTNRSDPRLALYLQKLTTEDPFAPLGLNTLLQSAKSSEVPAMREFTEMARRAVDAHDAALFRELSKEADARHHEAEDLEFRNTRLKR